MRIQVLLTISLLAASGSSLAQDRQSVDTALVYGLVRTAWNDIVHGMGFENEVALNAFYSKPMLVDSISILSEHLKQFPQDTDSYVRLGRLYGRLGDPNRHLEELNKAAGLGYGGAALHRERATILLFGTGAAEFAAHEFSECIKLGDSTAIKLRAVANVYSGDFHAAAEDFDRWNQRGGMLHFYSAMCRFALGEYTLAIKEWAQSLQAYDNRLPEHDSSSIAISYFALGEFAHALEIVEDLLTRRSCSVMFTDFRGMVRLHLKDYRGAIIDLESAFSRLCDTSQRIMWRAERANVVAYHLALARESSGDTSEANQSLDWALGHGFPFRDLLQGYVRLERRAARISPTSRSDSLEQLLGEVKRGKKIYAPQEAYIAWYRMIATVGDSRHVDEYRQLYAKQLLWESDRFAFHYESLEPKCGEFDYILGF